MTEWATGRQLGPYELVAHIGAGGMGEVRKARDARLNRVVAIKRLKGPHNQRFEQEAQSIAAMNHPHICQIYDVGPDYLVLEYIEGAPLKGPLSPEEALRLALRYPGILPTLCLPLGKLLQASPRWPVLLNLACAVK